MPGAATGTGAAPTLGGLAYTVLRRPEWRRVDDDALEVLDPRDGSTYRFVADAEPVLEALARGDPLDDVARLLPDARDPPGLAERVRVRRFALHLARLGYLEIPVAPPSLPLGWRLERELGRGGVGVAWLCRDGTGARAVAKAAWDLLAPLDVARAALRAEARMLHRLRHERIPPLVALHESAEGPVLLRGYVDGTPLDAHHRRPLDDPAEARRLVAEVADLLAHVHRSGCLLLDVRPGNLLRGDDSALRLLDVGLAREAGPAGLRLEAPVGTPGFVAPETPREGIADARSEVWALGAIYAFLRTGRPPPRSGRLDALLARLPETEAALVRKLAAPERDARPATAADAAHLLRG